MGLEVASFISELVAANPSGADDYATADDHLRLLKTVLQTQFPNFTAAAVTPDVVDMNVLLGVGGGIMKIPANIVTATPPVAEAVSAQLAIYDSDLTDQLALLGYEASNILRLRNFMHGGATELRGEDAAGVNQVLVSGDPDNFSGLYYAGVEKVRTNPIGLLIAGSVATATPPTTEAAISRIQLFDLGFGDVLSQIGFLGSNILQFRNLMHGGAVQLIGEDTATGAAKTLVAGDPDGSAGLYNAGDEKIQARTTGAALKGTVLAADPPTTEAVDTRTELFDKDGTTLLGEVGFFAGAPARLQIVNRMHGGLVTLVGEDGAGANKTIFNGNPAGAADLYNAGIKRLSAVAAGSVNVFSDGNTDAEVRAVLLSHQDGTNRGFVGFLSASAVMSLRNVIHGAPLNLEAENISGAVRKLIEGDPDTSVGIYHPASNAIAARTLTPALGGLEIDNQLTGGGFERVLTVGDAVARVKPADTTHSLDIIPGNDPDLTYAIPSIGEYAFELFVTFWGTATGTQGINLNVNYSGTVGVGSRWGAYVRANGVGQSGVDSPVSSIVTAIGFTATLITTTAYSDHITIKGVLKADTTGTLAFASSQQASEANDTNIGENSYLKVTKLP